MTTGKGLRIFTVALFAALAGFASMGGALSGERYVTVASTTSTENSGLFAHILPLFENASGIKVRVVAVGTGQAIKLAENGDADVLFVHHKPSEEKFVAAGFGVERRDVMYNDFVLVGPRADPARVRGMKDAPAALARIAEAAVLFASRGDESGTNKVERSLWKEAGINAARASGSWYRETGSGMGATLNTAAALGAYALSDRATWIAFANKRDLEILVEGDHRLFNQYGVILVSPARHPHVKTAEGIAFIDWLVGKEGQAAIAGFKLGGQQLFFPNASNADGCGCFKR